MPYAQPKKALARNGAHHRVTQTIEFVHVAHQLKRLRCRFAKTGARVNADALARHAGLFEHGSLRSQIIAHFSHDVLVLRVFLHGFGRALHMHDHQARIARRGNFRHGRVAKPRDVVDDACTRLDARTRHFGMTRVNAHAQA